MAVLGLVPVGIWTLFWAALLCAYAKPLWRLEVLPQRSQSRISTRCFVLLMTMPDLGVNNADRA